MLSIRFGSSSMPVTEEFNVLSAEILYLAGQTKKSSRLNVVVQGLTRESFHIVHRLSPNENS
jgi:hypothetical protein